MAFSNEIQDFLDSSSEDPKVELTWLGRPSGSLLSLGDILLFHYNLGANLESKISRMGTTDIKISFPVNRAGLIVRPVTKEAGTGNELLSIVKIDPGMTISADVLGNLYKNRASLGSDTYRTYILSNVLNAYRYEISKKP